MKNIIFSLIGLFFGINAIAQDNSFPFLDNKAMGSYDFIKANPEFDGRGVLIFILDNSVDPTIPGLINNPDGKRKVIDMQDFSNQIVLNLKEAKIEQIKNESVLSYDKTILSGWSKLDFKPSDNKYFIANLEEEKYFKNSAVKDINQNGRTDDNFAFLSFKISKNDPNVSKLNGYVKPKKDLWVFYCDTDADGNIDDEMPRFEYKYNYDLLDFQRGVKSQKTVMVVTCSVDEDKMQLIVNAADGSHGTHCAGIAAGNEIYGAKGNDGIAPHAYISSIKIGDNTLSGGATTTSSMKRAYEYGIEFMNEAGFEYAVFSMSYGIGSETPGRSEIEVFLDKFVHQNPNAVVVVANGNNGPGINSTGNPAGAQGVISAGAMLPPQILKNLYGSARTKNWVTHFSSRGGETSKPDVVAPGGASSTVPQFEGGDAFWGTSMACPQVAGAVAVLLSAAIKDKLKVNNSMVKKALKFSAKPIEGYTHIDYGNGLVNIPDAYKLLKILAERDEYNKIYDYEISTTNTYYNDKKGTAAFWKAGGYYPNENDKQTVNVKAKYPEYTSKDSQHNFYRVLSLSSNADWLSTDKSEIYIRGDLGASFGLIYDSKKLNKPGLYNARVFGKAKNENNGGFNDFDVQSTIIIPHKFESSNNYKLVLKNQELKIGDINRIFIETPIGASSLSIKITPIEKKHFGMACYLFKPNGDMQTMNVSSDNNLRKSIEFNISGNDLHKGIWEILPYSFYQSRENSYFDLEVQFYIFDTNPKIINKMDFEIGKNPSGEFTFTGYNQEIIKSDISGSILGYTQNQDVNHKSGSIYKKKIIVGKDISKVGFFVSMNDENFNKFTDIAFNIYDKNKKSVLSGGISRKSEMFMFVPSGEGEYNLEINGGFTHQNSNDGWDFYIQENYYYKSPISLKFAENNVVIYPLIENKSTFSATNQLPFTPQNCKTFGEIILTNQQNQAKILINKIEF